MVSCAAIGCKNRSGRRKKRKKDGENKLDTEHVKTYSFYEFPNPKKDASRFREWMHRLSRKGYKHTEDSRICEVHFEDTMFPEDLHMKYTGTPRYKYKYLVQGAVPTKFQRDIHGVWHIGPPDRATAEAGTMTATSQPETPGPSRPSHLPKKRQHTENRIQRTEQKRIIDELLTDKTPVDLKVTVKKARKGTTPAEMKIPVAETATKIPVIAPAPVTEDHMLTSCSATNMHEIFPQTMYGHPGVVTKDHGYATNIQEPVTHPSLHLNSSAEKTRGDDPSDSPVTIVKDSQERTNKECVEHPNGDIDNQSSDSESDDNQKQRDDPDYSPHTSEDESEDISSEDEDELPPDKDPTYIIYQTNLEKLMKKCQECGKPVISKEKFTTGTLVTYTISCLDGHSVTWRSQPVVRQTAIGNLMLAAAILFTGMTYKRVADVANAMNLEIFQKSAFNKIQRKKLFPVIQECYTKERSDLIAERKDPVPKPAPKIGDLRSDSPGHNGKYGTYTTMESSARPDGPDQILNIEVIQCTEVKNSNAMEAEGLRRGLKNMLSDGLQIDMLATDRHVQVRKIMRTEFPDIDHQFDIWHVSKAVVKKLNKKAAKKANSDLLPWIQCVSNHLWWCCATCDGDEQELRERWLSILQHVTNKHRWNGSMKYKKCQHKRLTAAQCKKKKWLKPNSSSFEALKEVVTDKYLLDSLPHMVKFQHTGALEVFHSQMLKYCPKRQHFGYRGTKARMMLAGLDWNCRECHPVLNKDGTHKMDLVFSKRRKQWVMRRRYHRISGRHVEKLMKRMLEVHHDQIYLPPIVSPDLPSNIARVEKPNKEAAIAERRTRFIEK